MTLTPIRAGRYGAGASFQATVNDGMTDAGSNPQDRNAGSQPAARLTVNAARRRPPATAAPGALERPATVGNRQCAVSPTDVPGLASVERVTEPLSGAPHPPASAGQAAAAGYPSPPVAMSR